MATHSSNLAWTIQPGKLLLPHSFRKRTKLLLPIDQTLDNPKFSSANFAVGCINYCAVLCLVAQSYLALCDPMDCRPLGSSVHGESPGKNTGVGCQALLQGIFAIQGSNPGLLHCRWIPYCLSHQRRLISIIHHIDVLLGKISLSHDVFHLVMMFSPSYTLHDSTW